MPKSTELVRADAASLGTIELVEAIVEDTRSLFGAQVDALKADMGERLASLGSALTSTLLAFSIVIVCALLVGIALAQTLIAIALPAWAAFWIVSLLTALLGLHFIRRARRMASNVAHPKVDGESE